MTVLLRARMCALSENRRVLTAGILALMIVDTAVHVILEAYSLPPGFLTAPLLAGEAVMCLVMLVLKLSARVRAERLDEIREARALAGGVRAGLNW